MEPAPRTSLTAQTLYAELLEQTIALEATRSEASLSGTFTTRVVKGRKYHYYVFRDIGGAFRQVYLGSDSEQMRGFTERVRAGRKLHTADVKRTEELCTALAATGCMVTPHPHAKVIQALGDAGLFRFGMVLVGTHAFTVLGNLLGARWRASTATHDVDFAYDSDIDVGVADAEELNVPDVFQRLQMGFVPIAKLNPRHPSTSFRVRGKELRIDFLTPLTGKERETPVHLPHLHTAADPLRYLDYLIENPEHGVVVAHRGILVNVPNAARFALHKLLLSQVRTNPAKVGKDIHQAAQLCAVLLETRPGELDRAGRALASRGSGWTRKLDRGIDALAQDYPEVASELRRRLNKSSEK